MKRTLIPLLALLAGLSLARGELRLFNWADYIPEEVVAEFERRYQARVIIDTFEAPEAMLAKLQAGGDAEYDVVVPPDYYVLEMARTGLIRSLDPAKLPNLKNLAPEFKDPAYDPQNRHSIPYQWGTTGIAYDAQAVTRPVDSWGVFFDPKRYAGPCFLLDEMRETIGAALKYLGYSLNDTDPGHLAEAKKVLLGAKKRCLGFAGGVEARSRLLSGDAAVVHAYSGDIVQIQGEAPQVRYRVPKEGGTIWTDAVAITRRAPHPELAYAFLNFILEPKIAAAISNYNSYATPVAAALPYLDPALKDNPAVFPPKAVRQKLEYIHDIGDAIRLYDRIWTELKSR